MSGTLKCDGKSGLERMIFMSRTLKYDGKSDLYAKDCKVRQ